MSRINRIQRLGRLWASVLQVPRTQNKLWAAFGENKLPPGNKWVPFGKWKVRYGNYSAPFGDYKAHWKINTVSICLAAGQVLENTCTPCLAVKFFVNLQLIISNPCLYGWNLDYFHHSVNFCELGTRYTLKLSASFRTQNRKYSVSGSPIFPE